MISNLHMPGAFPEVDYVSDRPSRMPTVGGMQENVGGVLLSVTLVILGRVMLDGVSDHEEKGSVCSLFSVP